MSYRSEEWRFLRGYLQWWGVHSNKWDHDRRWHKYLADYVGIRLETPT